MQTATAVDRGLFRTACSKFATGITVATVTGADGTPYGLTVNSFTSVSCYPPLVLICVDYRASALPFFRSSSFYGINVLHSGQRELSVRFSERDGDRFRGVDWYQGDTGVPLISGSLASFECCVNQTLEAGDHALFIAEVVSAAYGEGDPLLYFGSCYRSIAP